MNARLVNNNKKVKKKCKQVRIRPRVDFWSSVYTFIRKQNCYVSKRKNIFVVWSTIYYAFF